jgi:hypothetical protein
MQCPLPAISLAPQKDEALADAKLRIDHILADCDGGPG